MKTLKTDEMRAIEGGKARAKYVTLCPAEYTFTDEWVLNFILAGKHLKYCSQCQINKNTKGYWYILTK